MKQAPAPRDCPPITKTDLRPGDVLLSYGSDDWIDRLITKLDDGIYSHAAVWDGVCVVEATLRGVLRTTLEDEETQAYLDAYRWQSMPPDVHPLGEDGYPFPPVTQQADQIAAQGPKYSYHKLMLAAVVIAMSKLPATAERREAVRRVLSKIEAWIEEYIKPDTRGMTCTEVVSTSYWKAVPQGKYAVNVRIDGSRDSQLVAAVAQLAQGAKVPRAASEYEELKRRCFTRFLQAARDVKPDQLTRFAAAHSRAFKGRQPIVVPAGGEDLPLALITPRDFQRSPDLKCIGRLPHRPGSASPDTTPDDLSRLLGKL